MNLRKWLRRYDYSLSSIEKIFLIISGILLIIMTLIMCFNVIGRYFLGINVGWTVEMSEYILVFLTFLAAPWLMRKNGHVRVDLVLNAVSTKVRSNLDTITIILSIITCGLLFWFSLRTTIIHYQQDIVSYKSLNIPTYLVLVSIPLGSLLLTLRNIQKLLDRYKP